VPKDRTWVLVQNPGDAVAHAHLSYETDAGEVKGPDLTLSPHSRKTVNAGDAVGSAWSVSTSLTSDRPVIAERAVYFGGRAEGHDSIGATAASADWYFAEGSTGPGFETWVLVQNPGDATAKVAIVFMTDTGDAAGPVITLGAHRRQTVNVGQYLPGAWSVSTHLHADHPVVCERAMYGVR
jgi:hypothetical protein